MKTTIPHNRNKTTSQKTSGKSILPKLIKVVLFVVKYSLAFAFFAAVTLTMQKTSNPKPFSIYDADRQADVIANSKLKNGEYVTHLTARQMQLFEAMLKENSALSGAIPRKTLESQGLPQEESTTSGLMRATSGGGSDEPDEPFSPLNFTTDVTIDNNSYDQYYPDVCSNNDNTDNDSVYVVYSDSWDGDIMFAKSTDGGATFSSPQIVYHSTTGYVADQAQIAVRGQYIHIFFRLPYDDYDWDIMYARSTNGGASFTTYSFAISWECEAFPNVAVDANGYVYATYTYIYYTSGDLCSPSTYSEGIGKGAVSTDNGANWCADRNMTSDGDDGTEIKIIASMEVSEGTATFDDFEDGDYTSSPAWTVQNGGWQVNYYVGGTEMLEGDNAASAHDKISSPSTQAYGIWEWDYQFETTAYTETAIKFYFMYSSATGEPGDATTDGYYLRITSRKTAGDDDGWFNLYRCDNGVDELLLSTTVPPPGTVRHNAKVIRSSSGVFHIYYDGVEQGSGVLDNTYNTSQYIGIYNVGHDAADNPRIDDINVNGGGPSSTMHLLINYDLDQDYRYNGDNHWQINYRRVLNAGSMGTDGHTLQIPWVNISNWGGSGETYAVHNGLDVDNSGNPYVAWTYATSNVYFRKSTNGGTSFLAQQLIEGTSAHEACVNVDEDGNPLVLYGYGTTADLRMEWSDDGGTTWEGPVTIDDVANAADHGALSVHHNETQRRPDVAWAMLAGSYYDCKYDKNLQWRCQITLTGVDATYTVDTDDRTSFGANRTKSYNSSSTYIIYVDDGGTLEFPEYTDGGTPPRRTFDTRTWTSINAPVIDTINYVNEYYVRTDGSNANTGLGPLAGEAWQTISYAASQMSIPGDIVYVAPGPATYILEGSEIEIIYSGNALVKTQYLADTDGSEFPDIGAGIVNVDCGGVRDGFILTASSYIVLDGFTITNSNHDGILFDTDYSGDCSYNEVKNCDIVTPDDVGIYLDATASDPNYYLCNYNDIHDNIITNAGSDGIVIDGAYDGFVAAAYMSAYNDIYDNAIDCNRYGIYCFDGIDHTDIYGNEIGTNGGKGIYLPGAHNKEYTIIYNNMIYDCEEGIDKVGNSLNSLVYFNSFYTSRNCLYWSGNVEDVDIRNNIFYTTGSNLYYCVFLVFTNNPSVCDYNCYYAPNGAYYVRGANPTTSYNDGNFAVWQGLGYDNNSLYGTLAGDDPLYVNITPGSENLHLQALSPCITQATPLGTPYTIDIDGNVRDVTNPDIGADEYGCVSGLWTGGVDEDWDNPDNWDCRIVPDNTVDVTIPADPMSEPDNWPKKTGNLTVGTDCNSITMAGSSRLTVTGNFAINSSKILDCTGASPTITVSGDWTNTGTFNIGNSSVIFDGSGNSDISANITGATILSEDWESGTAGWTLESTAGESEWRRQSCEFHGGSWSTALYDLSWPLGCDYCWDCSSHPDINLYRSIDLTTYTSAEITYWYNVGGEAGWDYGEFYVNADQKLTDLQGTGGWIQTASISLDSYVGTSPTIYFRWVYDGGLFGSGSAPGYCVDDILITGDGIGTETFYNLIIDKESGGIAELVSDVTVENDLTVNNDGILSIPGASGRILNMNGANITNNGTISGYSAGGNFELVAYENATVYGDGIWNIEAQFQKNATIDAAAIATINQGYWRFPDANGFIFDNDGTITGTTGSYALIVDHNATLQGSGSYLDIDIGLGGSATATLGSDIELSRDLKIEQADVLDVSGSHYDITVGGDWTDDGTFNEQQGTVTFHGIGTSVITIADIVGGGSSSTNPSWTGSSLISSTLPWTEEQINVSVVESAPVITDVNIKIVNLDHTYDDDLDIYIRHPDATEVQLSTDNGGSSDDYTNTNFDDEAVVCITTGSAPFTGDFQPEGASGDCSGDPLAAFDGKNPNGNWTLRIYDDAAGDDGTLIEWEMTINYDYSTSTPGTETFYNLSVDKSASGEVELGSHISVENIMQMIDGNIDLQPGATSYTIDYTP